VVGQLKSWAWSAEHVSDKILRRILQRVYRTRPNEIIAPEHAIVRDYPVLSALISASLAT
jgi:hypothetical protein